MYTYTVGMCHLPVLVRELMALKCVCFCVCVCACQHTSLKVAFNSDGVPALPDVIGGAATRVQPAGPAGPAGGAGLVREGRGGLQSEASIHHDDGCLAELVPVQTERKLRETVSLFSLVHLNEANRLNSWMLTSECQQLSSNF